ncbi:MAG: CPBP family glutamic-type intramembrane protease [Gemmatimonadota bacterium]
MSEPAAPIPDVRPARPAVTVNRDLLLPYFAPYAAFVIIATVAEGLSRELDYAIRISVTGILLIVLRKHYQNIVGPRSPLGSVLLGAAAGVIGALVWVVLLLPFQDASAGEPYAARAFALRLAAATLVVPFAEELLCRGYILQLVTQWQQARRSGTSVGDVIDLRSVHELTPGAWTGLAVVVSSAAFALGHSPVQWPAAFGFSLLMAAMWMVRRDLIAPITAHAVTNFVLYIYVFKTGSWGLW